MKEDNTCTSELVAQSRFSSITVCRKCNLYHFHLGPMSFRLEAEVFESFCSMIVEFFLRHDLSTDQQKPLTQKH